MEQLFNLLALGLPDWEIPWAGIGGFLLGVGGTLSGIAAILTARTKGRDEATISTAVSRPDNGGGRGISSGDSAESGSSGSNPNSNG
jgi:hypothetical protein